MLRPHFLSEIIPLHTNPGSLEYVRERWKERTTSCLYENDIITKELLKFWLILCTFCYLVVIDFNTKHRLKHREGCDAQTSECEASIVAIAAGFTIHVKQYRYICECDKSDVYDNHIHHWNDRISYILILYVTKNLRTLIIHILF